MQEIKVQRRVWSQIQQGQEIICAEALGIHPMEATKKLGCLKNRGWHNQLTALLISVWPPFNQ